MKIALGTVQFGLKYGVANAGGQVLPEQAAKILLEARQAGIDTLDTAIAYGNSEEQLGGLDVQNWKVISKLPTLPSSVENVGDWVMQQVRGSLQRIGIQQLDGLLMHQPTDILGPQGYAYARALRQIRDEGLARAIGYSIYSPDELEVLCSVFAPDIVQAPYNIIDRRLATTGWMEKLAEKGVRIHTRSVFLQGLLLMPDKSRPPWFSRWQSLWQKWSEACVQSGLSPLEMSLGYVLAQSAIERMVVGVDSVLQMNQIIAATRKPGIKVFPQIESQDLELIEPSRWKLE